MSYRVSYFKGDYKERQLQANEAGVDLYLEHHFNSGSRSANYAVSIVATNHSSQSFNIARTYAKEIAKEFNIHVARDTDKDPSNDGVFVGGWDGRRGNHNLKYTSMPAVLLEPLFASNPTHAQWIRSEAGQLRLAKCLVRTIEKFYGAGIHDGETHLGFSVGHKYKTSRPSDRGVEVYGGGSEAEFAELVLAKAEELLIARAPILPAGEVLIDYTVESADNLFAISKKFNVSVTRLVRLNDLTNPDHIAVGQVLKIPCGRTIY